MCCAWPGPSVAGLHLATPINPASYADAEDVSVASGPVTVSHPVSRRDNLARILAHYGVSTGNVDEWYRAARAKVGQNWLAAGRSLLLSIEDRALRALRYDLDDDRQLVLEPTEADGVDARIESVPVQVTAVAAGGTIQGSFHRSAQRAGLPAPVIAATADVLGWKIDFAKDLKPGDRFRVLYERRATLTGRVLSPGRLLAVEVIGAARSATAFLYEDDDGQTEYLDENGAPLQPPFLRYPLAYTEISSTFSASRYHPILKNNRPHMGVDFSAPAGTPVRAVAAGTVTSADWKGDLGRCLEIDHGGGLATVYAHLRGFNPAVRPGTAVALGQVIGWVGQSGLATGPHLHFAAFDHGRYVNPLTMRRPERRARVDAGRFRRVRAALSEQLAALLDGYRVAADPAAIARSPVAPARDFGPLSVTL